MFYSSIPGISRFEVNNSTPLSRTFTLYAHHSMELLISTVILGIMEANKYVHTNVNSILSNDARIRDNYLWVEDRAAHYL